MSNTEVVKTHPNRGLEKVVADISAISYINPQEKLLCYRGYAVDDLASSISFEQCCMLLLNGELPDPSRLEEFAATEKSLRKLPDSFLSFLKHGKSSSKMALEHPLELMRHAISSLSLDEIPIPAGNSAANSGASFRLIAVALPIVAAIARTISGKPLVDSDPELSMSENFYWSLFERRPSALEKKALEIALITYADNGFAASTFTTRCTASSLSDIYSGIISGINTLKGPLHGGANEAVMRLLLEIRDIDDRNGWLNQQFSHKRRIMGFGHRLYRFGDSRVPLLRKLRDELALSKDFLKIAGISDWLESAIFEHKGLLPNVDLPMAQILYMLGLPIETFTPFFAASRTVGWSAHFLEQLANNRLIRPLEEYTGAPPREVPQEFTFSNG